MEIKGYITNLGKYNEGELVGKWIDFPIDEDDLNDALKEIGCAYEDENGETQNPEYEEYFFTDWDGDYTEFGEYPDIDEVNEIAEQLEDIDEDLATAILEYEGVDGLKDSDSYIFYPGIDNDTDLGYLLIDEEGAIDLSKLGNLANYFDYEAYGRDVRLEEGGQYTSKGYIFYNG